MTIEARAPSGVVSRGAFLSAVAHDLRNRLNAIAIRVALGREPSIEDGARLEQLEVIDRLLGNVRAFIDDLSELAALEDGRLALEVGPCDPAALLARAARRSEDAARAASVRVEHAAPGGLPPVRADEGKAVQLACNLVAELLPRLTEGATVTLSAEVEGDHVRLSVAGPPSQGDCVSAPAPSAAARIRASLPFQLARKLADVHGGQAEVEDRGGGLVLWFTLPVSGG